MLLSRQLSLGFVRAAVACATHERTSSFEPSSEKIAPTFLKLVTGPSFCAFALTLLHSERPKLYTILAFSVCNRVNPFSPSEKFYCYQMDESICHLRGVWFAGLVWFH